MRKKVIAILVVLAFSVVIVCAQEEVRIVTPFTDAGGMTGLILEATGYGLVIGAGVAASDRDMLGAALVLFAIAPICSTAGAWLFHGFMVRTTNFWAKNGVSFDASGYIKASNTYAIITTSAMVASILTGLLIPDTAGVIVSLVCSGVSVCADIIALYGVRLAWTNAINKAIVSSGVDWKTIQSTK
ncbi:MAG TPA: hypothetical protein P5519_01390 [Spirochaetia bacterium]|nr:hypothetical protein [Spirochaetales bacterium]HPD80002.1 hypothetical protein [Spirochaetales bacterium]HRS64526.1 hypothetical protein [Spirochaetia bacterium]